MTLNVQQQRRERLLETLRTLSAEFEYHTVLRSLISVASELTDSEVASILRYDETDDHLRFIVAPWFHQDTIQNVCVPIDDSIAGWVYKHATPVMIPNVNVDERFYEDVDHVVKFQTKSILAVPLLVKGKAIGVFEAVNKTGLAHYNGEDRFILETLASQAALILENIALEQRAAQIQAEAAQLEQMKKDFIAIASHELRTPLGLILGHSTFLRETIDETHAEQLDAIIRSGARLKEIIENLSNVENYQSGAARIRMRKFSLPNLIIQTAERHQADAALNKVTLHLEKKVSDLLVEGDAEKITVALSNLLKNAITFTKEGGHIFITLEKIPGYAKVSVIDDGIGISPKDLPHVFERFYQVESHLTRQHGGMGLGLSVAKAMIELHGGKILAASMEGKGSQFTFLLPLDGKQANAARRVFQEDLHR